MGESFVHLVEIDFRFERSRGLALDDGLRGSVQPMCTVNQTRSGRVSMTSSSAIETSKGSLQGQHHEVFDASLDLLQAFACLFLGSMW
jgi:hypothetical protein